MAAEHTVVTPTLVADQVYEIVERLILTGEIATGTPLRVRDVASQVGTSVMPVREAIRRLEEAGLAERIPHRGAVVKTFTVTELIDIYDVRLTLEIDATRKAAPKIAKSVIRKMESILRKLQKAVAARDATAALDLDEELLRLIYGAAGNPVLLSVIEQLWLQCRPYKAIGAMEAFNHNDNSLWEPQAKLVEAIHEGNVELAAATTHDSLASARLRLEKKLEAETLEAAK